MNLRLIAAVLSLWACTACKSIPSYMREVDTKQLRAPPDKALVVFVRSAKLGFAIRAHIMDDQTNFLGTAIAGGYFAVARPPGPQKFVVWSEVTDILVADLAPGLVYFVEVVPRMGVMRARFSFRASHRGTDLFPFPKDTIDDATQYTVDQAEAREEMDDAQERREKLTEAKQELAGMSADALREHTLSPNDGHLEPGLPHNGPIAMPAAAVAAGAPPPPPPAPAYPGTAPAATAVPPPAPAPAPAPAAPATPGSRRFGKGAVVRVKLKTGVLWIGEVVTETGQGLLLTVGTNTQMFPFADMETVDALTAAK